MMDLLGKPLILWSIEQALATDEVSLTHVSTDCPTTAALAAAAGADVPYLRPPHLASDTASSFSVIEHTINFYSSLGKSFDYVALIEPTSPLRKADDISRAIRLLHENSGQFDSLVTIGVVHNHPQITRKIDNGFVRPFTETDDYASRRQDLSAAYFPYGVAYVSKTNSLLTQKTFYTEKCMGMFIERSQAYEIDDLYDFICVEAILRREME